MGSVAFLWSGNLGVLGGVRLNWLWLATVGESLWFALAGTTIGQESGGQRHLAANPFPSRRARVVATSSAMPSSPPSSAPYLGIQVICAEIWQRGAAFPHSALPAPGSVNSICNRILPAATSRSLPAVLVSVRPSSPTRSSRGRRRVHSWASSCSTPQRRSWRWCLGLQQQSEFTSRQAPRPRQGLARWQQRCVYYRADPLASKSGYERC